MANRETAMTARLNTELDLEKLWENLTLLYVYSYSTVLYRREFLYYLVQ
jgi:hypothetical protein